MYTTKDIAKRLKKKKIILLSEYRGLNNKITCKCHCGKVFESKAHNVIYVATSCGCRMYQYKKGKDSYKFKGVEQLSAHLWATIKGNAKIRKLKFNITMKDAWNKLEEQNFICPLTNRTINITDKTASLDRIDSSKGYIKNNIRWVHKLVNQIKWDLKEKQFLHWLKLIHLPILSIVDYSINTTIKDMYQSYYADIKKKALKRNLKFIISKEDMLNQFKKQKGKCALTGIRLKMGYKGKQTASLDRIDSNKDYTKDNIQWVHKVVNVKLKRNIEEINLKLIAKEVYENHKDS